MNGDLSTSCNLSNCDCDKPKPMTDQRARAQAVVEKFEKRWPGVLRVEGMNKGEGCHGGLINLIATALADERRRVWEEAAKFVGAMDKATHPSDIADSLRVKAHAGQEGCRHEWGTDGAHSNEFCKRCFQNKPQEASHD